MQPWQAGSAKSAAVSRGQGHGFSKDACEILANLLWHFDGVSGSNRATVAELLGIPRKQRGIDACHLVAHLACLNIKTVRNLKERFAMCNWRHPNTSLAVGSVVRSSEPAAAAASDDQDWPLPHISMPLPEEEVDGCLEPDTDIDSDDYVAAHSSSRQSQCQSQLATWQQHPNYSLGMRVAELATFWITHTLPHHTFPAFVSWMRRVAEEAGCGGLLGNINHSHHFLKEWVLSLQHAVEFGTYAGLHALIPAIGMPSDLTRVIDIVSIGGVGLLVTIHLQTDVEGKIVAHLLGCPVVEGAAMANGSNTLASGSNFRFHSADALVPLVHTVEARYGISTEGRRARLALTLGDGAICGPGSINFVRWESELEGDAYNGLREGPCAFHGSDNAFAECDRHFPEAILHDRFLRQVHSCFAWGTGRLILRGVAEEFRRIAAMAKADSERIALKAAGSDAAGNHRLRDRQAQLASRRRAEANALERAGWSTWRRPLAPAADSTRKVVWQSNARSRIFTIYGLVFWGIRTRILESREQACRAARGAGREPTARTGMRTKKMRQLRALGRLLLDIRLLVFNCGRCDIRMKHATAINLIAQSTLRAGSNILPEVASGAGEAMLDSAKAVVAMLGIVRLIESLMGAPQWVLTVDAQTGDWRPVALKNHAVGDMPNIVGALLLATFPHVGGVFARVAIGRHVPGRASAIHRV